MKSKMQASELILTPEGAVYHLRLKPNQLASKIILVGDPGRVSMIAGHFSEIEFQVQNREINTVTGFYNNQRITVMSTGMGTDNIDIVLNELDALVNIDFEARCPKSQHTSLQLIRLGTSGALQASIEPGSFVASAWGVGIDGLLHFYKGDKSSFDHSMNAAFMQHMQWPDAWAHTYSVPANPGLLDKLAGGFVNGITATAPGFYGPQGRQLRGELFHPALNDLLMSFEYQGRRVVNFEMETSALYGLAALLGHQALTLCVAIANRATGQFLNNYHSRMEQLVVHTLNALTS